MIYCQTNGIQKKLYQMIFYVFIIGLPAGADTLQKGLTLERKQKNNDNISETRLFHELIIHF